MKSPFTFICALLLPFGLLADPVEVTIDCSSVVHTYSRDLAFGINILGKWDSLQLYTQNAQRFRQAGFRFMRYPGGTNANEYHWNGDGHYDSGHVWHNNESPYVTHLLPGFYNVAIHRGSTVQTGYVGSGVPAKVTDGDPATYWLSYPGDQNEQWIYLNIETPASQAVAVNRVVIDWGQPYATRFKIQYSTAGDNGRGQYAYNDTAWEDTSLGLQEGKGGHTELTFSPVLAKYLRVLCLTSSGSENQYAIKEIALFNGSKKITQNQNDGAQTPSVSSSVALGDTYLEPNAMDFEQFMTFMRSVSPAVVPLVDVNLFTGTPQEAADWVYYANVVRRYKVKYWEVGNEIWGSWEAGGPLGSDAYARRFVAFYEAMMAVDPSIIILPQFADPLDVENVTMDRNSHEPTRHQYYIDNFLRYLREHGHPDIIKAVSVHTYPTFMPKSEAVVLQQVDYWDQTLPLVKSWIRGECLNPSEVKIFDTEYNDGTDSGFTNHFYDSLFVSGYILDFLKNGGSGAVFFGSFGTPGPGQFDKTISSDFGMLEGGTLKGSAREMACQPRASFYALEMLHNSFSTDDSLGNTLVAATSSRPASLKVYANKRGDRKVSIMLINTDPHRPMAAKIQIRGIVPAPSAELITYSRRNYAWITKDGQSYAEPDIPPQASTLEHVATVFPFDVEPYSIEIITVRY